MRFFILKVFYRVVYSFFILWAWIALLRKKKWHPLMKMRFGFLPDAVKAKPTDTFTIWMHAVSVGEIQVIIPILEALTANNPKPRVVLSTVTKTGYELAQAKLGGLCQVIFAPLDYSWIVRRYIKTIAPKVFICAETEFWPNLLTELKRHNVSIIQINGRISDKAFEGYKRVRGFISYILKTVRLFCVQSDTDASRLVALGADPARIQVVGNLKFDLEEQTSRLTRNDLGLREDQLLWVAGSTHPGEEEILLNIFKNLHKTFPRLCFLIAPRHVERTEDVVRLVENYSFKAVKFSQGNKDPNAVIVVDTIGHLRSIYALSSIVFVGKSFLSGGGQNIIEPAYYGKAILTGPLMQNFKDIVRIFHDEKAFIQVKTPQQLEESMHVLLKDPQRLKELGLRAQKTVEKYKGTKQKTWKLISPILDQVLHSHV